MLRWYSLYCEFQWASSLARCITRKIKNNPLPSLTHTLMGWESRKMCVCNSSLEISHGILTYGSHDPCVKLAEFPQPKAFWSPEAAILQNESCSTNTWVAKAPTSTLRNFKPYAFWLWLGRSYNNYHYQLFHLCSFWFSAGNSLPDCGQSGTG